MKLVLAIINYDDANAVTHALTKKGFSSTKLATTGGFLMAGNDHPHRCGRGEGADRD